jgi:hypothetical protein
MCTPIIMHHSTRDTSNLRWFVFRDVSAYLEAVVCRITAPCLEKPGIRFFKQLTCSALRLLQFMNTTENLRLDSADFAFSCGTSTGRYLPWLKISTCLVKYSLRWSISVSNTSNVKTLYVNDGLVKELSRCLRLDDGARWKAPSGAVARAAGAHIFWERRDWRMDSHHSLMPARTQAAP